METLRALASRGGASPCACGGGRGTYAPGSALRARMWLRCTRRVSLVHADAMRPLAGGRDGDSGGSVAQPHPLPPLRKRGGETATACDAGDVGDVGRVGGMGGRRDCPCVKRNTVADTTEPGRRFDKNSGSQRSPPMPRPPAIRTKTRECPPVTMATIGSPPNFHLPGLSAFFSDPCCFVARDHCALLLLFSPLASF